jgi:hypothetical protein
MPLVKRGGFVLKELGSNNLDKGYLLQLPRGLGREEKNKEINKPWKLIDSSQGRADSDRKCEEGGNEEKQADEKWKEDDMRQRIQLELKYHSNNHFEFRFLCNVNREGTVAKDLAN